jgi:hypothetical protein
MSNVTLGLPAVLWWVVAFLRADEHRSDLQDMEIHVHLITLLAHLRHRIDAQIH